MSKITKTAIIKVTQWDIDNGIPGSMFDCPIALASGNRFPDADATVGDTSLSIDTIDDRFADYRLPDEAIEFIKRYDDHQEVKPFTFRATLIDKGNL